MAKALFVLAALSVAGCGQQTYEPLAEAPQGYVNEASLPEGWPVPGPYGGVVVKEYPEYRAAFAGESGEGRQFMTLFRHIKSEGIPMTAPVEMSENGDEMGFLYQNVEVGSLGEDGKVEVRDVPPMKVLSYAWQGEDSKANQATARAALETELQKRGFEARSWRLLGYNGPQVPRAKRTWELQAIVGER